MRIPGLISHPNSRAHVRGEISHSQRIACLKWIPFFSLLFLLLFLLFLFFLVNLGSEGSTAELCVCELILYLQSPLVTQMSDCQIARYSGLVSRYYCIGNFPESSFQLIAFYGVEFKIAHDTHLETRHLKRLCLKSKKEVFVLISADWRTSGRRNPRDGDSQGRVFETVRPVWLFGYLEVEECNLCRKIARRI